MDERGRDFVRLKMPRIGVGTYQIRNKDVILDVLDEAFHTGYRMIDTAQCYGNEKHIGHALRTLLHKYDLKRDDIFLISKLHPANHGREKAGPSIEETLLNLGVDYLDLFLIHWPGLNGRSVKDARNQKAREESWFELEKYYRNGKLRAVGVSNYTTNHLAELLEKATILPAINQCEFHPHYAPFDFVEYCSNKGIIFQAYSSLGSPGYLRDFISDQNIVDRAKKYSCTVPQFLLAWAMSQENPRQCEKVKGFLGISVLPRTTKREHVIENFKAEEIKVDDDDIKKVVSATRKKYCWDPTNVA